MWGNPDKHREKGVGFLNSCPVNIIPETRLFFLRLWYFLLEFPEGGTKEVFNPDMALEHYRCSP